MKIFGEKLSTWIIVAILGFFVFSSLGVLKFGSVSQDVAVALQTSNGTITCGQNPPVLQGTAFYIDTSNSNLKTTASTGWQLYKNGAAISFFPSTVTPNMTSQGLLACSDKILMVYGDTTENVSTYYRSCKTITVDKDSISDEVELKAYGAPILTIKNNTGNFGSLAEVDNESVAGTTYSSVTARVRAPSGSAQVYGNYGWALCSRFNSTEFAKVFPSGGTLITLGHVPTTSSKDKVECYELTNAYGLLLNGKAIDVPINIQNTGTTVTNGTTIDLILVDKTVSMYGGNCVIGFDKANDPYIGTGGPDNQNNNYIRIHSND